MVLVVTRPGDDAWRFGIRTLTFFEWVRIPGARSEKWTTCRERMLLWCAGVAENLFDMVGVAASIKKGPGKSPGPVHCDSRRERAPCFRSFVRGLRSGSDRFRFGFAAVELSDDIGANRPRRDLRGCGFLAFAVGLLVGRADQAALDQDVRALLDGLEDVFGESRAEDADTVPLGLRGPLVLRVLPRPLRGDRENGELRAVVRA